MLSDFLYILILWNALFLLGLIFIPITFSLFKNFIDRGYIFSKIIGIFITSYSLWLLSSLKVVNFTLATIIIFLFFFAAFNLWIFRRIQKNIKKGGLSLRLIIFEEILFLITLTFWSYVRSSEPSIRGLEKFMDFGFVNSILRSLSFPPLDMWLAYSPTYSGGAHINYYYFGHYVTAFLTKFTGIDSAITYNLMIAALFAFTFTLSFSIGLNLYYLYKKLHQKEAAPPHLGDVHKGFSRVNKSNKRSIRRAIIVGLLAAFLVSLGGNLHTIYIFTKGYPNEKPQPFWEIWKVTEQVIDPNTQEQKTIFLPGAQKYWYPNATRFIPFTIHEFPIYSFVVADLHGHVSDIPFVLLTIAVLLSLVGAKKRGKSFNNNTRKLEKREEVSTILPTISKAFENNTSLPLVHVIFLGLLLASMYMTNAWDGLIYLVLSGLAFFLINFHDRTQSGKAVLYKTFSASLFLLFFFLIGSLPFSINFKPFASGIGVLCAPSSLLGKKIGPFLFEEGKCQKSSIYKLATLWGFFYYNVLGFLLFIILPRLNKSFSKIRQSTRKKSKENTNRLFALFHASVNSASKLQPIDSFVLIMIFLSTLLLIFPEYLYIKDIYPAHYRANTMFKLGYQAFMMLGLSSAYIFMTIKTRSQRTLKLFIFNTLFFVLFFLVAIYPYFAIRSYYGGLKVYRGLDGLTWLNTQYPDDYKAILWLRKNIDLYSQPVIVEANGESYTDYARVSANTGLPTIIGWPVHEWLWRGSYDEAGSRIPEVAAIYESDDLDKTWEILNKYNVEYIFLGDLEREKYPNLKTKKFDKLGKVVYKSGNTKIYKVN